MSSLELVSVPGAFVGSHQARLRFDESFVSRDMRLYSPGHNTPKQALEVTPFTVARSTSYVQI